MFDGEAEFVVVKDPSWDHRRLAFTGAATALPYRERPYPTNGLPRDVPEIYRKDLAQKFADVEGKVKDLKKNSDKNEDYFEALGEQLAELTSALKTTLSHEAVTCLLISLRAAG